MSVGPSVLGDLQLSFHQPLPGSIPWTIHSIPFLMTFFLSSPFHYLDLDHPLCHLDPCQLSTIQLPVLKISGDVVLLKLVTSLMGVSFIPFLSLFLSFYLYVIS